MAELGDLTAKYTRQENVLTRIDDAEETIQVVQRTQAPIRTLEDLTNSMGLLESGEFRSGNGVTPGLGFTGGRFGYPGFSYAGDTFLLAGVVNDGLVVGISLTDGKLYFASGNGIMDANGALMNGLSFPLKFNAWDSATGNTTNREAWLGMLEIDGETTPSFRIAFVDPVAGSNLLVNPDFETGTIPTIDSWTQETGWAGNTDEFHAGAESAVNTEATSDTRVLTSARFATTAGTSYLFTGWLKGVVTTFSGSENVAWSVSAIWYDSGDLKVGSTVTIQNGAFVGDTDWTESTATLIAPATSTKVEILVTKGNMTDMEFYADDFSFSALTTSQTLDFKDAGLVASGGLTFDGFFGLGAPTTLTIVTGGAGAVTATKSYHVIAAETGTTDNLDAILGGTTSGDILVIESDSGDTITVRDAQGGAGQLRLNSGANKTLGNPRDKLTLMYDAGGDAWHQISYSNA